MFWLNTNKKWKLAEGFWKFGIEDENGNLICPYRYSFISNFIDGLAIVKEKKGMFGKEYWGIMNENLEVTFLSEPYDNVVVLNHKVIAIYVDGEPPLWGLITPTGQKICNPKYLFCPQYINGFAQTIVLGGKRTFINEDGHQICAPKYRAAHPFDTNGQAEVLTQNGRWERINKHGIELQHRPNKNYF